MTKSVVDKGPAEAWSDKEGTRGGKKGSNIAVDCLDHSFLTDSPLERGEEWWNSGRASLGQTTEFSEDFGLTERRFCCENALCMHFRLTQSVKGHFN